jgi:hypothetical protein
VTFFDEGRRFVSSSDDKKILVWEFNIPVPIKYVSEPGMHSMPAMVMHPDGKHIVGQSLDNQICTFCTFRPAAARGGAMQPLTPPPPFLPSFLPSSLSSFPPCSGQGAV